jgi:hypothetical protein
MRLRSCGGRPCVPGWTNPSPRTPSASPPQARSCGTLRPPRSVTSTLRETSIKGAPNRIVCETRTQAGFQSSRAQNRHLALCVYVKRSCSNCRCYVNVLAESWKIIHSCAYMRPGAMPSIRHVSVPHTMRQIPFAGFIWVRCVLVHSRAAGCRRRAGQVRPHRTRPRHGKRGAAMTPVGLMTGGGLQKGLAVSRVHRPSWQCPAAPVRPVGRPGGPGRGEATGLGQLSGPLLMVDGLVYALVTAPCWLVRDQTEDQGPRRGPLLVLRQPVLAVADRANSMAPIGVQLVKYVLHLLGGTGRWAPEAGWPHRARRGSGAGRPPRLRPPSRCPERNRGHRCHKDNGQRYVRRHHVLHHALPRYGLRSPQSRLVVWTGPPGIYDAMDSNDRRRRPDR